MKNSKYRFIVVSRDNEIFDYAYRQINELEYAYFDNHYPYKKSLKFLQKIHWSTKINSVVNLPFKTIWIKDRIKRYIKIFNTMPPSYSGKCIILFASCIPLEKYGLSRIIRQMIPDVKIVYFFQDLISSDIHNIEFLKRYKKEIDLIYTYDKGDAEVYSLQFHNVPYSDLTDLYSKNEVQWDVSFVGKAKNRLTEIIAAFYFLKKSGLNCRFYITDVSKEKQIKAEGIVYSEQIPYNQYLDIVSRSKCILEIVQKESCGNTLRVNDAIIFDKILLTNNKGLLNNSLYDPEHMYVYDDVKKFDVSLIKNSRVINSKNKKKISPECFLHDVEVALNDKEDVIC